MAVHVSAQRAPRPKTFTTFYAARMKLALNGDELFYVIFAIIFFELKPPPR
jgi:hypothetical protein